MDYPDDHLRHASHPADQGEHYQHYRRSYDGASYHDHDNDRGRYQVPRGRDVDDEEDGRYPPHRAERGGYRRHGRDDDRRGGRHEDDGRDYEPLPQPEELPPAFLYCVRQLQDSPYEPLRGFRLRRALSMRHTSACHPRPHLLHKYLVDFFVAVNGRFGVQISNPHALEPTLIKEAAARSAMRREREAEAEAFDVAHPPQPPPPPISSNTVAASTNEPSVIRMIDPRDGVEGPPGGALPPPPLASAAGDIDVSAMREIRNRQLRQIQQSSKHPKLCSHFGSREGCRRGANCPFFHPGWDGSAATASGVPSTAPLQAIGLQRKLGAR